MAACAMPSAGLFPTDGSSVVDLRIAPIAPMFASVGLHKSSRLGAGRIDAEAAVDGARHSTPLPRYGPRPRLMSWTPSRGCRERHTPTAYYSPGVQQFAALKGGGAYD